MPTIITHVCSGHGPNPDAAAQQCIDWHTKGTVDQIEAALAFLSTIDIEAFEMSVAPSTEPLDFSAESSFAPLSDLPPRLRSHPFFQQGYNRGYSDRAYEEFLARRPTDENQPVAHTATSPPIFDVTAGGLRHRLAPGVRAMRDISTLTAERFVTETPCCGRHMTLAIPGLDETSTAVCCHCRVLFAVGLVQEESDGFGDEPPHVAVFVVEALDVVVAQHRAGRWERQSGKHNHQNE